MQMDRRKLSYSVRKSSVGVVSVAVASLLIGVGGVQAEEVLEQEIDYSTTTSEADISDTVEVSSEVNDELTEISSQNEVNETTTSADETLNEIMLPEHEHNEELVRSHLDKISSTNDSIIMPTSDNEVSVGWNYKEDIAAWLYMNENGEVTEEAKAEGYWKNGVQLYDILLNVIKGKQLYFGTAEQGGVLAKDKWSYSPSLDTWIHSDKAAFVDETVSKLEYVKSGVKQYDAIANVNGNKIYFEPEQWRGIMAINKWSFSPSRQTWFHSMMNWFIDEEVSPKGYYVKGKQQYDAIANVNGNKIYFEPAQWQGIMAINKWSFSPNSQLWYLSQEDGIIEKEIKNMVGTNQAVQNVLNKYKNLPIFVYFESIAPGDSRTAMLRADTLVYGASAPKLVLAAYTQDRIERGLLSWDTKLQYNNNINYHPESYGVWGSGSIRYEENQGIGKYFTVKDIVYRTMAHSDNRGANMLLHYVGYADKADFDRFTTRLYGTKYSQTMNATQLSKTFKYVNTQKEQFVMMATDKTNYDGTKIDVLPVNTHQKIGHWSTYNHSTGLVKGDKPFVITVLTNFLETQKIGEIVKEIYAAAIK